MDIKQVHHIVISGENINGTDTDHITGGSGEKNMTQPLWLLIVEVVTGVSLLSILTLCAIAGLRRCKDRSSGDSIPWTRAISWKESTVISIGQSWPSHTSY
jgi:hypothetical protein